MHPRQLFRVPVQVARSRTRAIYIASVILYFKVAIALRYRMAQNFDGGKY